MTRKRDQWAGKNGQGKMDGGLERVDRRSEQGQKFLQLNELEEEDKRSLRHIVDTLLKKNKMKKLMEEEKS